jgi:hypothetical protein
MGLWWRRSFFPWSPFLAGLTSPKDRNPPLDIAVRIVILVLGLGAVVWRRTKFQPMRLQDITGLQGVTGLLKTLEKTTPDCIVGRGDNRIGFISRL